MSKPVIPSKMKQIQINKFSTNFREATQVVEVPVPKPRYKQVLIKNRGLMLNASDVLMTQGLFTQPKQPPFGAGIEAIGEIVATGPLTTIKVGQAVAYFAFHCFAEYMVTREDSLMPIESCSDPSYGAFFASGGTAYGAFEKKAPLKKDDVVIVTAAAGATGHIAVQLAKIAGCHVIGTCSSDEKVAFLKSIGCDRPINYKKESVDEVLRKEYPNGVNVAYECVGNELFDICLQNLALNGKIICIGTIDVYQKKNHLKNNTSALPIPMTLMMKSADLTTLYMPTLLKDLLVYFAKLRDLYESGKLKVRIDKGEKAEKGPFRGLEKVADAIEYLFSRHSMGKIYVEL